MVHTRAATYSKHKHPQSSFVIILFQPTDWVKDWTHTERVQVISQTIFEAAVVEICLQRCDGMDGGRVQGW
jgi:hypothetical protein